MSNWQKFTIVLIVMQPVVAVSLAFIALVEGYLLSKPFIDGFFVGGNLVAWFATILLTGRRA